MESPNEGVVLPVSPVSIDTTRATPTRRSARAKKAPAKYDEEYVIPANDTRSQPTPQATRSKRKAAQTADQSLVQEDAGQLLEEILAQMSPDERKEYGGWVELESEPGFFNVMLRDLGAEDFKVQEVYSLDADTLELLSKPVYGLVFLFEYEDTNEPGDEETRQDGPPGLWFANQTTANACATVALMNIVMNAPGASFGRQLQEFKDSTAALPPPHRGHLLNTNDFIRSIHNSVARRIDLIAEDLSLDNKFEESLKRTKKKSRGRKNPARPARKRSSLETNYHYIAYVPVDGQVWELDGFQCKPLCLGAPEPESESWLDAARAAIQERMMRGADFSSYSLLAVCRSPVRGLVADLAANLAGARALAARRGPDPGPDPAPPWDDAARLAQWGLTREAVARAAPPPAALADPDPDAAARRLAAQRDALEARYAAELAAADEAAEAARGRQRDYTPAIHQWVRALAQKGALRALIQEIEQEG
ncbi:cysteine proteinase [Durotheca rogersii]|uniref:cysteine proteinase n=1 Tax=Durotheca rogersii TaxID=419775 RepID=UPI00221EA4CC|nr:cysteine proteinase [Durotheca rogersii]KAI5859918.1 cysteine proteinase [Durotheca rogersii]